MGTTSRESRRYAPSRTHGPALLLATACAAAWAVLFGSSGALAGECTRQCKAETASCIATRCGGLRGAAGRDCRETCRGLGGCASIRTLAYVVTECRTEGPSGARVSALHQTLKIRRGNCAPTTVMELPFGPPVPDPFELCRLYGEASVGVASVLAGAFQRLSVSPDASGVVFEVTDDVTLIGAVLGAPLVRTPPQLEGLYYVRFDGSGLRRIGPASRYPIWSAYAQPGGVLFGLQPYVNAHMAFDPSGRVIVFSDIGPGPSGEDAPQIFSLDVTTTPGVRTQLTHFLVPRDPEGAIGGVSLGSPEFLDPRTAIFFSNADVAGERPRPPGEYRVFAVAIDGSELRTLPEPEAVAGSRIDPRFGVAGGGPSQPEARGFADGTVELFVRSRNGNLLQLTNYGTTDLRDEAATRNGGRILFITSADPLGENPSRNCQLFSINNLADGLRQLTHFREVEHATSGCNFTLPRSGCGISTTFLDRVTGEIVFYSSCAPFGTNPSGGQLFATRADGRRLRQLTATKGLVIDADGTVTAELPGPFRYSSVE